MLNNQSTTQPKTQKEMLSEKLASLNVDITPSDKTAAAQDLKISTATVIRYLRGDVRDNEQATRLIEFFSKQITARAQRANLTGGEVAA